MVAVVKVSFVFWLYIQGEVPDSAPRLTEVILRVLDILRRTGRI
jgi:hypothetical protein